MGQTGKFLGKPLTDYCYNASRTWVQVRHSSIQRRVVDVIVGNAGLRTFLDYGRFRKPSSWGHATTPIKLGWECLKPGHVRLKRAVCTSAGEFGATQKPLHSY